ncbi:protein CURVATURE THYLAKOID 1B, chloroplastic-like [Momordica charantia]|uniref:Protein CURVATURE THYLAKOID 1B, chloroplastic-like n=1 Tax=Momordica charantia TaxID=3673 RepID=A0A6J1C4Z6_MOMCH|nr:protein CURVATURE THYLAKOID 1B, chloroplastic-like [Momordica charantia]
MAMELCASQPISHLPVFSTLLAGNPQLRPKHALPIKMTLPSRTTRTLLHFRYRDYAISLPRAAASDDSNGYSPLITEERDSVTTLEDSPSASSVALEDSPAEELASSEIAASEVPKEEPVEVAPVVTLEDSPSAEKNEIATSEEPKEEPVVGLLYLQLESGDTYSLVLYGAGAFVGIWLVSAIVGAVDSIPLIPKLLEVVGLGYTVWFTARFLLFKESRDELAAKIGEVKEQVLGLDDD